MITVLVVLTVAAASGVLVALSAPDFVKSLGLGKPTPVAAPAVPHRVLGPLAAGAPLPSAGGLATALDPLAGNTALGRFTGVVLDPATGAVLWSRTPERALVPGSTGKLLTAAATLLTLNSTDTLVTRVVAGPDPDTVVLVGGGDPTLTAFPAGRSSVYPEAPRLADLAAQVKAAVPGKITKVLLDTGRYRGPTLASGWLAADVPGGFVAPIESLMVDGGRADPTLQDGPRVAQPALAAGRAFAELLGVDASGVAAGVAPADAKVLAAVESAPVAELVEHLMRSSDNVLAETLGREVAISRRGEPTFTGAAEQVLAALTQAGFDVTGAAMSDSSGLSTEDKVPARLLGVVLGSAAAPAKGDRDTTFLRPILTGLPVAGGDGTLDDRFGDGASGPGRGVVRAKTGTLTSVSSLAGVVTDTDGRLLVFALMSNGATPAKVRPRLDAIAAALSQCGCR